MNRPLDELYLRWLYSLVGSITLRDPSKTYWILLKHLYTKEFVWLIPNDDNRLEDGKDLRSEFLEIEDANPPQDWLDLGCSMLEMLIGLARRMAFETDRDPRDCFWELIVNLKLDQSTDMRPLSASTINFVLDTVIWRTYRSNGAGGLFPLKKPKQDQRDVELWYQLSAYILEG